jgi:oligopeptide transport system substrate-binding protein
MEPLTAHDFAYAWKTAVTPDCKSPYCHLLFPIKNARMIKAGKMPPDALGVRVLSDRTLSVKLEYRCPEFLLLCSHWIYSPLLQSIDEKEVDSTILTNGPFMIARQNSDQSLTLVKNPGFWDSDHVVPERVTIHMNSHPQQTRVAFEQGDLDWIGDPFTHPSVQHRKPSSKMCSLHSSSVRGIALNVLSAPFASRTVRTAFSLALNRACLCNSHERASHSFLPKEHSSLDFSLPLPFNMIQAQAFFRDGLREQGLQHSVLPPLVCLVADLPNDRKVTTAVASAWEEAFGITIHLKHVHPSKLFETLKTTSYDLVSTVWHNVCKDSLLSFEPFKDREDALNLSRWVHEPFSSLIMRAERMEPSELRHRVMQEAEQMLIEEMPIIPLFDCSFRFLHNPSFPKFIISPFGTLDFQRSYK